MELTAERIAELKRRLAAGEKITRLGREVGISWQKLHGILHSGQSSPPKAQPKSLPSRSGIPSGGRMTGEGRAMKDADGVYRVEYANVGEAVADCLDDYAQNDSNAEYIRGRMNMHLTGRDKWANHFTAARLTAELSSPSAGLISAVSTLKDQLQDAVRLPSTPRRRVARGQEFGDEIDGDRFLSRTPNLWDRSVRVPQRSRTVRIGVNLSVAAYQIPEALKWRGAAAVALADLLTSQGVNVELVGFFSLTGVSNVAQESVAKVVVKPASSPLDIGAATFCLCEIAFARLPVLYGSARHWPGRIRPGMGRCANLPEQDREGLDFVIEMNIVTRQAAESWLRGCLTAASAQQ